MNFLAHTWLSFSDDELVGNMLADYIRNRERHLFSEGIQKGIALHRAIDTFTDFYERDSYNAETTFLNLLNCKYDFKFYKLDSDFINDIFIYKMRVND